jgi:hypothetical protein
MKVEESRSKNMLIQGKIKLKRAIYSKYEMVSD